MKDSPRKNTDIMENEGHSNSFQYLSVARPSVSGVATRLIRKPRPGDPCLPPRPRRRGPILEYRILLPGGHA